MVRRSRHFQMIAVVYHFFAHYREPVLRELAASGRSILLVGCPNDPTGSIKAMVQGCGIPFQPSWGWFGPGGIFVQPAAITTALNPRVKVLIYLGDVHFLCTWIGAVIGRLLGKTVLFWTHGYTRRETGTKALLRRMFYQLAHGLLLYGNRGRDLAIQAGLNPDHLHVIYNSLDYEQHDRLRRCITSASTKSLRSNLFPDSCAPIVLFSARLTRRKRFDLGIEAIRLLAVEGHKLNLIVIGDGPERASLERLASLAEVPTRFLGAIYDEGQLARYFIASTVVVSPGEVGLTAMHAMAYGRPVITHNDLNTQGPEVEAIVDGVTGRLVSPLCPRALAAAIHEFSISVEPLAGVQASCIARIQFTYSPANQAKLILASLETKL